MIKLQLKWLLFINVKCKTFNYLYIYYSSFKMYRELNFFIKKRNNKDIHSW